MVDVYPLSTTKKEKLDKHMRNREGVVYKVYLDSLGKPTGGAGHLLTKSERAKFKVGDPVSKEQVQEWYEKDILKAKKAATLQMSDMEIDCPDFFIALVSVNFQLGAKWTEKFHSTWPLLLNHEWDQATANLKKSLWYRQTPVRVNDFIAAINRLKLKNERPLTQSRTMQGGAVATASIAASEVVTEITEQVEPLVDYSETLKILFLILALAGIALTIYARIDDRKAGKR